MERLDVAALAVVRGVVEAVAVIGVDIAVELRDEVFLIAAVLVEDLPFRAVVRPAVDTAFLGVDREGRLAARAEEGELRVAVGMVVAEAHNAAALRRSQLGVDAPARDVKGNVVGVEYRLALVEARPVIVLRMAALSRLRLDEQRGVVADPRARLVREAEALEGVGVRVVKELAAANQRAGLQHEARHTEWALREGQRVSVRPARLVARAHTGIDISQVSVRFHKPSPKAVIEY